METQIKVTPNYSKQTFTIRKGSSKYRTSQMNRMEFLHNLENTSNDWDSFLRSSGSYSLVK